MEPAALARALTGADDAARDRAIARLRSASAADRPTVLALIHDKGCQDHLELLFDALLGSGAGLDDLLPLAESRRPRLQVEGARALGVLGDPGALPLLRRREASKRDALRAAAEVARAAIEAVVAESSEAAAPATPEPPAPPPPPAAVPPASTQARALLAALAAGDDDALAPLLEVLQAGDPDAPRPPEHPLSPVEVDIVRAVTEYAAVRSEHLLVVADVLHELRRGRYGCSVGAEMAAKRGIDTLTDTQLISSYRAWREDLVGEAAPAPPPPPAASERAPESPPEPGSVPLPPSDYWDRPPRRKKPWWKFW